MPSERVQRQIDRLLDEAEQAIATSDWALVKARSEQVLTLDPANSDARSYGDAATRGLTGAPPPSPAEPATPTPPPLPRSFIAGRYRVIGLLGEGGRKVVYRVHDTQLDRDVAFALLKIAGLDADGRARLQREARALGRLSGHPNVVTVFEVGEDDGAPFMITELLEGGDLGELLRVTPDHRLPLVRVLDLGRALAEGLSFVHGKGVVHRDLKPGNVWLSAAGVPKLGDLGLALALQDARLTQAGLVVGTALYMAPEQALGGEVTPRSDLYSLGCVLYELVTGRPPFLSDDPTIVITQHLTAAPVAPSWLSDRCPPDLEALILQLLAKRLEERPASAQAVLEALAAVDSSQRSASHSDPGSNPLERLARGVFVGREPELERLRQTCDRAFAGQGGVVLLVGEPGIGKTRTAQELETYARLRGAQVLWGRSHEEAGAPAYWPWMQVGRQWATGNDPARLVPELGSAVAELARLFPALAQLPGVPPPPTIRDPEGAQFALFDAFAQFLRVVATPAPLLVVLDDLHWADKPTLQMLQHLAEELGRMRVLLLGTYRDTELARTHPLAETLVALNRGPGFARLVLRGLARAEVGAYVRTAAGVEPSDTLVTRLYEETEGNPFFLSEVVNLLTQEGTLTAARVSDIRVPDGVREALGRRLDRVSPETNALLQVAAIIGREFTYDTLTLLGEQDEEQLLRRIEEAMAARVIEELPRAGRYRFTHALMQETLLGELSTTRKVRLHGQVGEALEKRWGARAEERASRLALHFGEAATLSGRHAAKAVRYAKLAAGQAEAATAWAEAARQYERCLTLVSEADDRLGEDEAALYAALGRCARNDGEYRVAWRALMRATDLYRQQGDGKGVAETALEALLVAAPPERHVPLAQQALALIGDSESHLEARLLAALLTPRIGAQLEPGQDDALRRRLDALLVRADSPDARAQLALSDGFVASRAGHWKRSAALYQAAHAQFVALGRVREAAQAVSQGGIPLAQLGTWTLLETAPKPASLTPGGTMCASTRTTALPFWAASCWPAPIWRPSTPWWRNALPAIGGGSFLPIGWCWPAMLRGHWRSCRTKA